MDKLTFMFSIAGWFCSLAGCSQLLFADLEIDNQILEAELIQDSLDSQEKMVVVFRRCLGLEFQIPPCCNASTISANSEPEVLYFYCA